MKVGEDSLNLNLNPNLPMPSAFPIIILLKATKNDVDFLDVRGQENVKRALEKAAAGGHNIIIV